MKKIIFENPDKSIGVITPSPEALKHYTIEQVARKDVPFGLNYIIVDSGVIPTDRLFRNAWELPPETVFDGVGSESNTWEK